MRDFSRTRLVRVAGVADGRRTRGIACGSSDMWVVGHVAWIRPTDGGATFGMSAGGGGDCARVRAYIYMYIYTCVCVCDACVTYAACVYVY